MGTKSSFAQEDIAFKAREKFMGILSAAFCVVMALFFSSAAAAAATATFTLQDQTGLPEGHKIYVLGYSATPGYYLNSDGTWLPLPTSNGQIPCYQLGSGSGQISQVVIDSAQSTLSARVYFFLDKDGTYPQCNNGKTKGTGIFGTNDFSYTYTNGVYGVVGITQASIGAPNVGLPAYAFSEIGPGPSFATIDVSQVDLFSFPVTIQASVSSGPSTIGNSQGVSFSDNSAYAPYMNALAGKGGCKANPKAPSCAYLDLIESYGNYNLLLNPGGFLASNTSAAQNSSLNKAFDGVIKKLWSTKAHKIVLNNGGNIGGVPQDTFTGKVVSIRYPCNATGKGCPATQAIKFVGENTGYVAYIFSPIGYANGCAHNKISGCPAGSIASSGNQVFSGSGVFASTASSEYLNLNGQNKLPDATTKYGVGAYASQVARLGLIMTQAMNHGVALMKCAAKTHTWKCWNVESNWYPVKASKTYPDITQNLFARFMHTASNKHKVPFFVQPPGAVKSAGRVTMGMAYGFSNDEQPTPPVSGSPDPEVPSKMDQTVAYNGAGPYTITLGPWEGVKPAVSGNYTGGVIYNNQNGNWTCLTVSGKPAAGSPVTTDDCNYSSPVWKKLPDGRIQLGTGPEEKSLCLDVDTANPFKGNKVQVWNCAGSTPVNQTWSWNSEGSTLRLGSKCIIPGAAGSQLSVGPCNGATQTWIGLGYPVAGSVMGSGGKGKGVLSNAIYIPGDNQACEPDESAAGYCKKQFGGFVVPLTGEAVNFELFNDGYSSPSQSVKTSTVKGKWDVCSGKACRKWFGRLKTANSGVPVICHLFGDGYTSQTNATDAIFYNGKGQVCQPNGKADGECRKWFGRCYTLRSQAN